MLKSRFLTQTTPAMPPVHTYTVDDDDEGDICPVCDGECTCTPLPSNPLSMAELSLKYPISSPSSGNSYPPSTSTPTPPLKIKLSIPPSMLANRRLSKLSKSAVETTLDCANAGYTTLPKKRGRPPKTFPSPPNQKLIPKYDAKRPNLKARAAIVKKVAAAKSKKRRRPATSDEDSSSSSALSDVGMDPGPSVYPIDDQFPTFLSASALSSNDSDSDSSSSSLSDFSDSSIEAEEENFIFADINNKKSRVKRGLGADDPPLLQKRRTSHNNDWIIRPRKKSEGPSDVEMNDVDSDATEQDDKQDDGEQDDEDDDADATEEEMAMTLDEDEDITTDDHRRRYVGHATGWSEEEDESSFDADLFFANLSGSDSIESDSDDDGPSLPPSRHHKHPSLSMAEDGDQSDISGSGILSECTESGWTGRRRAELESLPFEVTEGWDGQIMFTNGVGDGQGLIDIEFEADAERFVASPRKPRRQRGSLMGESDDDDMEDSDDDMSDGGYEEEDGGEGGEGDTTDEELVGEDELPNERAMALFSLPLSVSAINPLSTVSSPTVPASRRGLGKRMWGIESPSPADILSGRVVFWDSDDELSPRSGSEDGRREGEDSAKRSSLPLGPRKGVFSPSMETRQAVIGEDRKGAEVPSPHPRFNRGRGRTNVGRFSAVEHILRRHLLTNSPANHQASSPVLGVPLQEESASSSIQQLLLSSVAAVTTVSADDNKAASTPALQSIELDDVLEASFLHDPEGRDATNDCANNAIPPSSDNEAGGVRNLSRWDLISVGAFRQTRESWEGARHHPHHHHTPGSTADYGNVMKSSPMASMLWQNGANGRPASAPSTVKGKGHGYGKLAKRRQLMMSASTMSSPLILPLSSSSLAGDRTPVGLQPAASITSTPTSKGDGDDLRKLLHQQQQQQQHQKSRKEQRRERKSMKKKSSYGGPVHQIHAHHHGHHSHHHHPNSKNRSASSTQRSNFFAMGVPPLNL